MRAPSVASMREARAGGAGGVGGAAVADDEWGSPDGAAVADPLLSTNSKRAPAEVNLFAYLTTMLLGFAMLIPWNVLLNAYVCRPAGWGACTRGGASRSPHSATPRHSAPHPPPLLPCPHPHPCSIPYFQDNYPDEADGVAFYMTAAYIYPQLPLLFALVAWGSLLSFRLRIVGPLAVQAAVMVALPIVVASTSGPKAIWGLLTCIFFIGLTTAVVQSSGFAFCSILPPLYGQAVLTGQGVAGITAAIADMIFQAALPDSVRGRGRGRDGTRRGRWLGVPVCAAPLGDEIQHYKSFQPNLSVLVTRTCAPVSQSKCGRLRGWRARVFVVWCFICVGVLAWPPHHPSPHTSRSPKPRRWCTLCFQP